MKYLIVGLGNIGAEYADTRHNIGFKVLDALAEASNAVFTTARYGDVAEVKYKGRTLVLLKPSTYMNLSGKAVRYWLEPRRSSARTCWSFRTTLRCPSAPCACARKEVPGPQRTEEHRRTARHRGVCAHAFRRGRRLPKGHQVEYVLGEWTDEQRQAMPERLKVFVDAIRSFATVGCAMTMNFFNKK